jgi:competence protein ComEA
VPQRPADSSPGSPPARWAPTGRAVGGLVVVVVVAVLVALVLVWQAQPAAQAAPRVRRVLPAASPSVQQTGGAGPTAQTGTGAVLVVHVVGAVRHPGLVRLPGGARVADAVRAAGGATGAARLASVNLARLVVDGEQLVVQRRGGAAVLAAPAVGAPAGGAAPTAPVDLNTATLESLDGLPGIGPVLAQRILDWRAAHSRFSSVDELGEVSGIGEATLSDLRPLVVV